MIDLGGQDGAPVLSLGGGMFKASIILFDTIPGTKEFTVPEGVKKIRAFVIGPGGIGGGGYSEKSFNVVAGQKFAYTVGVGSKGSAASTSSFGGLISASGGMVLGGVGLGGDVNFNGGNGTALNSTAWNDDKVKINAGGSAATRYGNGSASGSSITSGVILPGAGFPTDIRNTIDGWGLGMVPGSYGQGATYATGVDTPAVWTLATMGGGGASAGSTLPGIGGGASSNGTYPGGNGAVGVEVLI